MSSEHAHTETLPRPVVKNALPPPQLAPIRVVLVESSGMIRELLARTLGEEGIAVVATCSDRGELGRALAAEQADVVIADVRMPPSLGEEGIRIATQLRASRPHMGVVLLSQYAEPAYVMSVLESGPGRAYLLKQRLGERGKLSGAIVAVAEGGTVVDPEIVDWLIEARARVARSPLPRLSRGERELLALIVEGKANAAISTWLAIPQRSVATQVTAIFEKLDLSQANDTSRRALDVLAYLAEEGG